MPSWLARFAALATASLAPAADQSDHSFFENRIRPVLASQCFECHSSQSERLRGGLRLDNRTDFLKGGIDGPIVTPGNPAGSLLIQAIRHDHPEIKMPPPKSGRARLSDDVISDFTAWVKAGAPYPETGTTKPTASSASDRPWSLQPLRHPEPPRVADPQWPRQPLDSFILAKLESAGLAPEPKADLLTLIRRATFDLTGLPPEPEEIDAFLADPAPDAFAKVVDRLLASPHYGEHWGRHWLDVVRYADTAGDTADYPVPDAWRYRNYVIDSFNTDKPYHEFVREQIAGDLLAKDGPPEKYAERITATGFLAISRRFGFDSENYHHLTLQDTIDTLGQSFLGLTLGCARCHHHKFDPVSTQDYYGLYGIFASTRFAFPGSEQKNRYRAMVPLVPPDASEPALRSLLSEFAASGTAPQGILRSLDDLDGDFEMQRAASGGSYGVLVPPWFYDGSISVSPEAQSPFRSLHPFGSVGVTLPQGTASVWQALPATHRRGRLHISIDFRARGSANPSGHYQLALGLRNGPSALTAQIAATNLTLFPDDHPITIPLPAPGDWHSLHLTVDLDHRSASGSLERPGESLPISPHRLNPSWQGAIESALISSQSSSHPPTVTDVDNFACQTQPIPPTATVPAIPAELRDSLASLEQELAGLIGYDGDLEGQPPDQPPAAPWHPGPNSAVKITAAAQSPFHHLYPAGKLGISLPNQQEYNGLGLNLPQPWNEAKAATLHASFDFRPGSSGDHPDSRGTWRFHLGHGPASAAVELGFHATTLFLRSGKEFREAAPLQQGQWHHVQLTLDLRAKKYTGSVFSGTSSASFSGDFAEAWDGTIDYAFIDSGGHLSGTKPSLAADNFSLGTTAIPAPVSTPADPANASPATSRPARIAELRAQIDTAKAASKARQQALESKLASGPIPLAYGVTDGTPQDARIQQRGEPDRPGDSVPRGFLAVLGSSQLPPQTGGSGRRELAHWITDHNHALTSRIIANRIWQYHFGHPLVRTPNDFGNRSEPPTHPELLDHLASSLQQMGWSLKSLHRSILLSATWQQATAIPKASRHADLYAGFPRRRLTAEELRDSILAVSGTLDRSRGEAHPFPPATTWSFSQHNPFTAVYDHRRRSVYLMVQRLKRHPFLALFDGADPNASTPDRRPTTVPTQALYFLNDPFVHENSLAAADHFLKSASDESARIGMAYRRALGRPPSPEETSDAIAFLAAYRDSVVSTVDGSPERPAWAALVRTLFGSNEFLHCD